MKKIYQKQSGLTCYGHSSWKVNFVQAIDWQQRSIQTKYLVHIHGCRSTPLLACFILTAKSYYYSTFSVKCSAIVCIIETFFSLFFGKLGQTLRSSCFKLCNFCSTSNFAISKGFPCLIGLISHYLCKLYTFLTFHLMWPYVIYGTIRIMSLNINCLLDQKCCLPWNNHVVFLCRNFFQLIRTLSRRQRGSEGTTLYVLLVLFCLFLSSKMSNFKLVVWPLKNFWICTALAFCTRDSWHLCKQVFVGLSFSSVVY